MNQQIIKEIKKIFTKIVNRSDPSDLINMGAPDDEYNGYIDNIISYVINYQPSAKDLKNKLLLIFKTEEFELDEKRINLLAKDLIKSNKIYMKNKDGLYKKYKGKKLGYWESGNKFDYYIDDFINKERLFNFFDKMNEHEMSLTKSGFNFLSEYYIIDELASEYMEARKAEDPNITQKTVKEWLEEKGKYVVD